MLNALAFVTFRQWRLHRLRLILTLLGVALGVAAFFAVKTSGTTLSNSLHDTVERLAGRATLQVTGGESGFPIDFLQSVLDTPGVQLAEPVIETVAQTNLPGKENLLLLGLDSSSDLKLYEGTFDEAGLEIENTLAFSSRSDSIAVSRTFADRHGLKEGDLIPLYTQYGLQNFTVRGFFKPTGIGAIFGGNIAVMDLYAAQAAFNRGDNLDRIDIVSDANVDSQIVQERLQARIPVGLAVTKPDLRGQGLEKAVSSMNLSLSIISFLALIIGIFIIFNSLSISVAQRRKEIGTLRALGVERGNLRWMFIGEAIAIGLIGSVVGILLGYFLAGFAIRVMSEITVTLYGIVSTPQHPVFHWEYAFAGISIGVFVAVAGAWLPARAAARLNPVLALHNIEIQQREELLGKTRLFSGFILIVAGLLLTYFSTPRVGLLIQCTYSVLMQLGMILLLPKMVQWGAIVLRPVMERLFGAEGVIAVDTISRTPRRTSATVGALMIGLSFVFAVGAFIQSHKDALNRVLDRTVNADLLITTSEQMRSRTYHFSEELAGRIGSLPGVDSADNVRVRETSYESDEIIIISRNMDIWFASSPDLLSEGDQTKARELTARGEGFLVSENFASRHNLHLGDKLSLETPTGTILFPIVGILEYYYAEKGTVFLSRDLYKKFWQDEGVDYIVLNLKPGAEGAALKKDVEREIAGEQRAFIYTHEEYKQWVNRLTDQFFTLTYLQMVIAVFVAALGIINTLVISVAERKSELGIIRAIGGLRGQVRKMVLLEAVSISLIGIAAGIAAGTLSAFFLVRTVAMVIAGFRLEFHFPFMTVFLMIPAVLSVALFAAWLPARHAMRVQIRESINYE